MIIKLVLSIIALFAFTIFVHKLYKGEYENLFSNKLIQKFTGASIILIVIASIIRFGLLRFVFNGVLGATLTIVGFILIAYIVWNLFIKSK